MFLLLILTLCVLNQLNCQTLQWYGLEPYAKKPMISMFTAIYKDTLYLVGGSEPSVTTLNLNNIYMNDYNKLLYQPDLNVKNAEWTTERYQYNLPYGLFCNQSCSTQISWLLYIVAPFKNRTNQITKTSSLFIYDLNYYQFKPTNGYTHIIPYLVEYSCIVNNNTHIFIIGGGYYSNKLIIYDIINDVWSIMNGSLNIGRINFGCSFNVNMSNIFIFGGETSLNSSTSSIEMYIISNDTWLLLTSKLSFKRSRHNCILDINSTNIYIFGGGGCSEIDNVCSSYRNLVEIFSTTTFTIRIDEPLLLSGISNSYSSNYYKYIKTSNNKEQIGSWFNGIFIIGGNTENKNATFMVQYRIINFEIFENNNYHWIVDNVSLMVFILCGLLLFIIFVVVDGLLVAVDIVVGVLFIFKFIFIFIFEVLLFIIASIN
eukprot:36988_1